MSPVTSPEVEYVPEPSASGTFVLANATVVDVATGTLDEGQDVEVRDGRIVRVGPTSPQGDASVQRIDATGRFVVPGYVDAHAHALNTLEAVPASYALMLASGVVGYRQMSASPELLRARAAGELPHPQGAPELLALCGDLLTPMNAATADQARAEVAAQARQGADFIKAGFTSHDPFLAATEAAHAAGIPLAGHLPDDLDPREAARAGVRCIEHLGPGATLFEATSTEEAQLRPAPSKPRERPLPHIPGLAPIMNRLLLALVTNPSVITRKPQADALRESDATYDEQRAHELAALFVEHETWQCPTLIRLHTQRFPTAAEHVDDPRLRYMHPDEVRRWRRANAVFNRLPESTREALQQHWDAQLRLAKVFADDGVPMLTGTDANGAGWVIPGFALHDEFDLLSRAGLSPLQILQAATLRAAEFFHREDAGQVREGFRADLVVLRDNPLENVAHLHGIDAVVREGRLWDREALDTVLQRSAEHPAAR